MFSGFFSRMFGGPQGGQPMPQPMPSPANLGMGGPQPFFGGLGRDPATGRIGPGAALNDGATLAPMARTAFMGPQQPQQPPQGPQGPYPEPRPYMFGTSGVNMPEKSMDTTTPPDSAPAILPIMREPANPPPMQHGILKPMGGPQQQSQQVDPRTAGPLLAMLMQRRGSGGIA